MSKRIQNILTVLLLSVSPASQAEVLEISTSGFSVRHAVDTPVSPADSWAFMVNHISEWWNPEHSWSGKAENLYIKASAGGCFCERLTGDNDAGWVEHLRIIFLQPNREIRFDGALGPLQSMAVQGRMVWKIEATEAGSVITFTYLVHGYLEGGFAALAPAVDGVISEQLERLGQHLETR